MPISNQKEWDEWVKSNDDPYGKCCVNVARKVMEKLDTEEKWVEKIDTHKIICEADKEIDAGGITGFMASCVAQMVSCCHSRGDEFRRIWNHDNQIQDEGDKANESGGILNTAIINIG